MRLGCITVSGSQHAFPSPVHVSATFLRTAHHAWDQTIAVWWFGRHVITRPSGGGNGGGGQGSYGTLLLTGLLLVSLMLPASAMSDALCGLTISACAIPHRNQLACEQV